jgi:heat shock protein HtpX
VPKPLRIFAPTFFFLGFSAFLCIHTLAAQVASPTSPEVHQTASPLSDDDPDEGSAGELESNPKATFLLMISFDTTSRLTVRATALPAAPGSIILSDLKSALQEAVGCSLTDSPSLQPASRYYLGSCTLSRSASPFLRQGQIPIAPLQRYSERHNLDSITLSLDFPNSDFLQFVPPPPSAPAEVIRLNIDAKQKQWFADRFRRHPIYGWDLNQPIPASITYRFGYQPSTIERGAVTLILILIAPIALVFWLGRKALSADVTDKSMVWFSYMRALSWILNGLLIFWWAALEFFHVEPILRFCTAGLSHASVLSHPVVGQILGWVPPSLIWLCCYRLSHPVQEKLRGLRWTRRELTFQSLYSVLAGFFPVALFLTALELLTTSSSSAAMFFAAAVLVRTFAANALLKLTGMQPHALTSGPLRDRAFDMAHRLGVKLLQVYLIPSGKGQMANAFASSRSHIAFTDVLLQRMSAHEIDFVMAHELTHLQRKHPQHLVWARWLPLFLGVYVAQLFFAGSSFALVRYLIIFALVTAVPYFISRRFEYSADAGAVTLTGDPRAAISALFKLSELNMMPTQWSRWNEKWLTHPSTLRRAQALAKMAAIPFEEIPAIAQTGTTEVVNSYLPPATSGPTDKLYSTQYKKSAIQKIAWALLATLSFTPALFALAARHLRLSQTLHVALFVVAIPVTFAAVMILSNFLPLLTRGNLIAKLEQKFLAQGVQTKSWAGIYVGFAPSAAPRTFEFNSSWDFGYLFFRSDRICFWGEEIQFALRRDQISAIKLDISTPSWLQSKRVYISWRDNELGTCGVFNIACDYADSVLTGIRVTTALYERMQLWWKTPGPSRPVPQPLDKLSAPAVRTVTAAIPGFRGQNSKLFSELFITSWIAALAAMLCGLPFHLMSYLMAPGNFGARIPNLYHSPGAGWFVVFVAALVRLLSLIPALRYKDQPILVAQPPARVSTAIPPPPTPAPSVTSPTGVPVA